MARRRQRYNRRQRDNRREHSNLSRKERQGWSRWIKAMIPDGPRYGFRERNTIGWERSNIEGAFHDTLNDCGIYEWKVRGPLPQLNNVVVYVGSTCTAKPGALKRRIMDYLNGGSHKNGEIDHALGRNYELWVRVKRTGRSKDSAENKENYLLDRYDYAWNIRNNGGRVRNIL